MSTLAVRKPRDLTGRQQVSRVPPYRPGCWVKVKNFTGPSTSECHRGKVRRVMALTSAITAPDQKAAIWYVHFGDGRCVEWHLIERFATPEEIARAEGRTMTPAEARIAARLGGANASNGVGPSGYTHEFDAAAERDRRDREGEAQRLGVEL